MATYSIFIIVIVIAIWAYSMFSIISNKFKNEKEKTFWLIGVAFMPILSVLYIFVKKDLLK